VVEMGEGLIGSIMKAFGNIGTPKLTEKEIIIEMTPQELESIVLKSFPPDKRNLVKIELHEGRLVIRVRLF